VDSKAECDQLNLAHVARKKPSIQVTNMWTQKATTAQVTI